MEIVTKIAPLALALIMLGLGLGLSTDDFIKVLKNPKIFLIGVFAQIILLPLVAYILVTIINLPAGVGKTKSKIKTIQINEDGLFMWAFNIYLYILI